MQWATPQARDYRSAKGNKQRWGNPERSRNLNDQVETWPTPSVHGNHNAPADGTKRGTGLSTAVKTWPTPDASARGARKADLVINDSTVERRGSGQKRGIDLQTAVRHWPTPSVANASGGQTSRGGKRKGELLLQGLVKKYPTPRASEYKDCGPVGSKSQKHMDDRSYLCARVKEEDKPKGCLNPDWVCWLMGVPIGWTSLDPVDDVVWSWDVEPQIPRVTTDCNDRIDQVRMLGNGVVPQTAAKAWDVLTAELELIR